jgi:uncharacterized protein YxjI
MRAFEVTQAILTVGTVYHVRKPREEHVLYSVRGVLMSPVPKFRLVEGEAGEELGTLTGNFVKTRYEVGDNQSKILGSLAFPAVAFKKTLTLTVGDDVYEADGGVFRGVFQCKNAGGELVLEIAKELAVRDTFLVRTIESMPLPVVVLAAVAIHSRFYEMV